MTNKRFSHPIIGQEAICPEGLGRVANFKDHFPEQWIEVETYVNNRKSRWAPYNVRLIPIQIKHENEEVLTICPFTYLRSIRKANLESCKYDKDGKCKIEKDAKSGDAWCHDMIEFGVTRMIMR